MNPTPIDCKQLILKDARLRILKNHSLEQIAVSHGFNKNKLKKWLMSMEQEHSDLRQLWVDNMLAMANEEIDNVRNKISKQDTASWCAESKELNRTKQSVHKYNSFD